MKNYTILNLTTGETVCSCIEGENPQNIIDTANKWLKPCFIRGHKLLFINKDRNHDFELVRLEPAEGLVAKKVVL